MCSELPIAVAIVLVAPQPTLTIRSSPMTSQLPTSQQRRQKEQKLLPSVQVRHLRRQTGHIMYSLQPRLTLRFAPSESYRR